MSGSTWRRRARRALALVALLGASGCMQVPEPLELTLDDDEAAWRVAAPTPTPTPTSTPAFPGRGLPEPDYEAWPRSADPWLASLGEREVRRYPLWPTPVTEPCPAVMFGRYSPALDGGDMFERVAARLAAVEGHLGVTPSEITLLRDHLHVPGLRLVAASDTSGGCMLGWSHTHCFVTATAAYCPDGSTADLERLVRDHRLVPFSLDPAGWFELAVVMSGAESIVLEPGLVRECTRVEGAAAQRPTVEIDDARVTVRFTAITEGDGIDYSVAFAPRGRVTMETAVRWQLPADGG
jgi:hypothetical protein